MTETRVYLDIKLIEQKNTNLLLMTQLLSKIHRFFRLHQISDVGCSFPQYGGTNPHGERTLGETVRLVSPQRASLERLMRSDGINTLIELKLMSASKIQAVPDNVSEVRFRKDPRPSRIKKLRREDPHADKEANDHLMPSHSISILIKRREGAVYPVFIDKIAVDQRVDGVFNSYGLANSTGPSVPEF